MRSLCVLLLQAALVCAASAQQPPPVSGGDDSGYDIRDDVLIKTREGATLSATVVRKKGVAQPLPTLLSFDIYTDPSAFRSRGKDAADHGYVGVTADTRGKRLSPDEVVPYEHEVADTYEVIDWIAHQSWSNGAVGMRGGSYSGFTAWAATKHLHPALKTIAVSAAAIPGLGLPMYNNVFLSANYGWAFYVADNKYLDDTTYNDSARWGRLLDQWFSSGRPYREIDRVDGTPNPLLQRWLRHPAYDGYWQAMVPYKADFAHINIPVLTVTGYYDDGQISALEYLKEHYRYRPHAEHYLVIGPYDHFGTHRSMKADVLRGYAIDPVAQFSTPELTYRWMDYVLRRGKKPDMLEARINYEVMGANEWRHAPSLQQMSHHRTAFYFTAQRDGLRYRLAPAKPARTGVLEQSVNLADRAVATNAHSYPDPVIQDKLEHVTELMFESAPFEAPRVVSGAFAGELDASINKRDFDLGVTVFEQLPDGRLLHLAYWLGRASFASDASVRRLLTPGKAVRIPFATTVVSRQMSKGSRLLVLLDVNKNFIAQVNYGTGKDVSDESLADADGPLQVRWHTDSYVNVPFE
jgi:putative CocE/NonD family hydrolase